MTIIQFPEKATLVNRMEEAIEEIDYMYHALQRAIEVQDKIEVTLATVEDSFNEALRRYAAIVGVENIPVKYLEYSTNVEVRINDQGEFEILYKEDEEESEQPSGET